MFEGFPTTLIGGLVALGLIAERFYDRWARRRDVRRYKDGADRRQHNTGNPNGLTRLTERFDKFESGQKAEWDAQRGRDGEMHEKINGVSERVARLEGPRPGG